MQRPVADGGQQLTRSPVRPTCNSTIARATHHVGDLTKASAAFSITCAAVFIRPASRTTAIAGVTRVLLTGLRTAD